MQYRGSAQAMVVVHAYAKIELITIEREMPNRSGAFSRSYISLLRKEYALQQLNRVKKTR